MRHTYYKVSYQEFRVITHVICDSEACGSVLHEDSVLQVEVENVTTLVCLSHLCLFSLVFIQI